MLASPVEDINKIPYTAGILASLKLDGIRALVIDGQLVSRTFKPIPNNYIREMLSRPELSGLDGELTVGDTFQSSSSGVMSHDGAPDFTYWVFDHVSDSLVEPFHLRLDRAKAIVKSNPAFNLKFVEHTLVNGADSLSAYEAEAVSNGYEGVMIRKAGSPYKCGRSSAKEGFLGKIKRFEDGEAKVVGFFEMMHNQNPEELDAFGKIKRSTKAEGMVPAGVLGGFEVVDLVTGVSFEVSTGLNASQRQSYWLSRPELLGKIVKYKHQPAGQLNKPRLPVFLGFRDSIDL
jgi:DNA ligase-1